MKIKINGKMVMQCAVALTMLTAALLSPGVIFAQDSTTPEASGSDTQAAEEPTATPTLTEIPTEVPTLVDTDVPTEVPTDEPTAIPTDVSTEIPTEIPTEITPTPEATLTPTVTPTEGTVSAQTSVNLGDPSGTIYTRLPYFYWDHLDDAYSYELFVYQITNKGKIKIYNLTYKDASYCNEDTGVCKVKPGTTLAYGNFEWNVRALYKTTQTWSDFNTTPGTFTTATYVPTLKAPNTTTYDNPPEFSWTEVSGATVYQMQIYNKKGTKVLDDATITPTCAPDADGVSICTYTPADTLDNGWYKWRIRAYQNSTWRTYTGYIAFIVAPDDISTDFDDYSADWIKFAGAGWTWTDDGGNSVIMTNGGSLYWTSLRNAYQYSDYDVTAVVKRESGTAGEDGSYPASYLAVRMSASKNSKYFWYTGYLFGYTNAGYYSVWRVDSASKVVAIQPWTAITGTFNEGDYNELTVSASGDHFVFSINGDEMVNFDDDTYDKGYIGFEEYRPDSSTTRFYVDSLNFTNTSAASVSGSGISAAQAAANLAAQSSASGSSITGSDEGSIHAQATVPSPIEPSDTILYTTKPTFKWNDTGEDKYIVYLAKITAGGENKVYTRSMYASTVCSAGECAYLSPSTLSVNDYVWKVKSYDGTDWSNYSDKQYFSISTTQPTAKEPYQTVYDTQPTFTWTEIVGASQYWITAYDSSGSKVVNIFPQAADVTCTDHVCTIELEDYNDSHGDPLELDTGKYKWRVAAMYNSKWGVFSAYREFTVAADFESDFETTNTNWTSLGAGSWSRSNGNMTTYGSSNRMTGMKYAFSYSNFTFNVRMKRDKGNVYASYPANNIFIRTGASKTSDYQYYPGYLFGYTNGGYFSVWRVKSGGSVVAIQPWTYSASIVQGDYNELSVTADGSDFEFDINGDTMVTFSDDNITKGYVGFEMFRPGSSTMKFYVDDASITLLASTALSAQSTESAPAVSAEQQALNDAALANGQTGSIYESPAQ